MAKGHKQLMNTLSSLWWMSQRGWLLATPAGKVQTPGGGWMTLAPEGTSDMCGYELIDGKPIACFIEVKTINDSVKTKQKQFLEERAMHGCKTYICKPNSKGQLTLRIYPYQNGQKEILL